MEQLAAKRADVFDFLGIPVAGEGSSGEEVVPPGQRALGFNGRNERDLLPPN